MSKVIFPHGKSRLEKWKVKEGSIITEGSVLCDFYKESNCKLKSKFSGTVSKLLVKEGETIDAGDVLALIEECQHQTRWKNVCADCGSYLFSDQIAQSTSGTSFHAMEHSIPDLLVSEKTALSLGRDDEKRLLESRRLVLLVDLDHTLIHTTTNNVVEKDLFHFQLPNNFGQPQWYHTKFRPGTRRFLTTLSQHFEMHIYTFGVRAYAHAITKYMDPQRKFFQHRILSRNECFHPALKTLNLRSLFPCGDRMVVIVDDREDVWQWAPNLIRVKPFIHFEGFGDVNAPPRRNKGGGGGKGSDGGGGSSGGDNGDGGEVGVDTKDGSDRKMSGKRQLKRKRVTFKDETELECKSLKREIESSEQKSESILKNKDVITEGINAESTAFNDDDDADKVTAENIDKKDTESQRKEGEEEDDDVEDLVSSGKGDDGVVMDDEVGCTNEDGGVSEESVEGGMNGAVCAERMHSGVEDSLKGSVKEEEGIDVSMEKVELSDASTQQETGEETEKDTKAEKDTKTEKDTKNDLKKDSKTRIKTDTANTTRISQSKAKTAKAPDDYLLHLEDILMLVHSRFYSVSEPLEKGMDVKQIIPEERAKVLQGCRLVFSGVLPVKATIQSSWVHHLATSHGAVVMEAVVKGETTHVVGVRDGTEKIKKALKGGGVKVVSFDWLVESVEQWRVQDEGRYPIHRGSKWFVWYRDNLMTRGVGRGALVVNNSGVSGALVKEDKRKEVPVVSNGFGDGGEADGKDAKDGNVNVFFEEVKEDDGGGDDGDDSWMERMKEDFEEAEKEWDGLEKDDEMRDDADDDDDDMEKDYDDYENDDTVEKAIEDDNNDDKNDEANEDDNPESIDKNESREGREEGRMNEDDSSSSNSSSSSDGEDLDDMAKLIEQKFSDQH